MKRTKKERAAAHPPINMAGYHLFLAFIVGFVSGFILSVPVGPVNVTIINESARRGLGWALLIGFGASFMEVIYCALAFTGFASLFTGRVMKAIMELVSFAFMLYLGIRFLMTKQVPASTTEEGKLQQKLHPHSAFAIGLVRVMGNPGVFLFWIVLAVKFRASDWVGGTWGDVWMCVAGVGAGTSLWFSGLSYAVSRGYGKFSEKTLLRMEHGSGIAMLLLAAAEGAHIVVQMVKHQL